ncbi:MAG: cation transporter, partial [Endomicrobiia bacterium]
LKKYSLLIVSILVISKILGKRSLIFYLGSIILGSIIFALIIDFLLPSAWFSLPLMTDMVNSHTSFYWIKVFSGIILLVLIINSFIVNYLSNKRVAGNIIGKSSYKVDGMHCENCKNSIIKFLKKIDGVESVEVNLKDGIVYIKGNPEEVKIKETVSSLGFLYKGKIGN